MNFPKFVPDFFKYLTCEDCSSMYMEIPQKFCNMQQNTLQGNWILNIRNGYTMHVTYDHQNLRLEGMSDLFTDFQLVDGEVLIFQFVDGTNFNVYIMCEDGSEMEYPSVLHASQLLSPNPVSVSENKEGQKFLKFISNADPTFDEVVLLIAFWRKFGAKIPEWFAYVLKNHFRFGGHFEFTKRKQSGLKKICEGLKLSKFEKFELLVFTYDSGRLFTLTLFDGSSVEVCLDVQAITLGTLFLTLRYPCAFKVQVMPSHMLAHCPRVTVSVQFKRITNEWKNSDNISIYKGNLSWKFEIKKYRASNRTTIYGGWIQFRDDMQLNVGDLCYFRWINESYHHFRVEIIRAASD
ncbi:hypothetical protein DCAR_0728113 [Daucus carota subsp. sativus]|uniref:Uncharacterized protein n=1 Tax=Daucus carota subsp. sativus TaxID=79200 RepID=A0A161X435_DAUCS|nr:hypothetical protein DCAR_0728113 [Daucus carota subsp. sativus]